MKQYTVGVDFGTLSARAVVVDCADGRVMGEAVYAYPHGVISDGYEEGTNLQKYEDYVEALSKSVSAAVKASGVALQEIVGIGLDVTAATLIPVDASYTPLCLTERFRNHPHTQVKLWKHHSTTKEADEINAYAKAHGDEWLSYFGGKMTAEMGLPKVLEVYHKAPEVYEATYEFVEMGDYLAYLLTGKRVHASCFSDFKYAHRPDVGYPEGDFYRPMTEKLPKDITYVDQKIAGLMTEDGAKLTGLLAGTKVALSMIDAHAALVALQAVHDGDFQLILGTSGIQMLNAEKAVPIPGICGCIYNTVIPGLATYEAGQSSFGDTFDWYVKESAPEGWQDHRKLTEEAMKLTPGESGLVGIDWLCGNRSILSDSTRRGVMTGISLTTKPWEVYRAWLEAACFGTRIIMDNYAKYGIEVKNVRVGGGIGLKNPLLVQIMADVLNRELYVSGIPNVTALGSAIYAAAAADVYPDVIAASKEMGCKDYIRYAPHPEHVEIYNQIYQRYQKLHEFFGSPEND